MLLFFIFISQIGIEMSTFIYSNFAWELHGGCLWAAFTWLWLGLKSAEELSHSPQWRSTVRTLVNLPKGSFAWTNHIYFQITQPDRVVPLLLCTNRCGCDMCSQIWHLCAYSLQVGGGGGAGGCFRGQDMHRALYRKSNLCIPEKGIARGLGPNSYIHVSGELFIYFQDRCARRLGI